MITSTDVTSTTSSTLYDACTANSTLPVREAAIVDEAKRILSRHMQRVSTVRDTGHHMTAAKVTIDYLTLALAGREREEFHVLYLNTQHALIMHEVHSVGTVDSASVYPRDITRQALMQNAKAVIVAHNHPSGSPEPSHADRKLTARLQDALSMFDVRVLDHVIITGAGDAVSFAEKGYL